MPYYARWPHEVHIYPKRHVSHFTALGEVEVGHLADMLRKTLAPSRQH